MFLKSEVVGQIDTLKAIVVEATDGASRDIGGIHERQQTAMLLWQEKKDEITKKRDALDEEEAMIDEQFLSVMHDTFVALAAIKLGMSNGKEEPPIENKKQKVVPFAKAAE